MLDEIDGVDEVHIDNPALFFVEVHLFDAFEGQSRGEGPLRHEEDYDCLSFNELVEFLPADYFGELLPRDLPEDAHNY